MAFFVPQAWGDEELVDETLLLVSDSLKLSMNGTFDDCTAEDF